mmetsp:Transcript_6128/g.23836  ORF Transcript_6128/g.23836 Transcript_6128/m.23836 type:complete len:356 (-) Transcript_6128:317-1384(-)|eukprot:scaffold285_cov304-Pinguiococcus_pyrenoidosus.AAC.24
MAIGEVLLRRVLQNHPEGVVSSFLQADQLTAVGEVGMSMHARTAPASIDGEDGHRRPVEGAHLVDFPAHAGAHHGAEGVQRILLDVVVRDGELRHAELGAPQDQWNLDRSKGPLRAADLRAQLVDTPAALEDESLAVGAEPSAVQEGLVEVVGERVLLQVAAVEVEAEDLSLRPAVEAGSWAGSAHAKVSAEEDASVSPDRRHDVHLRHLVRRKHRRRAQQLLLLLRREGGGDSPQLATIRGPHPQLAGTAAAVALPGVGDDRILGVPVEEDPILAVRQLCNDLIERVLQGLLQRDALGVHPQVEGVDPGVALEVGDEQVKAIWPRLPLRACEDEVESSFALEEGPGAAHASSLV